ncbi:hypothetical protein EDD18DRAFT_1467200 [Armillaria luteobubalina]|uniref:Uncharacterized protein n=1 Tax=Armillaria luteobubalina TaxID=153913 RepID=A0AA39PJ74_9AGAR|nr:hypothetical protein EDD18DRAFT_1467200 [Armillaria luteobubalina]
MAHIVDLSILDDYPYLSDFEQASRFLKTLRSSMKLEDVPPSFLSESCIQRLLRENPMYYVNLARRHADGRLAEFEDTPLLCPYSSELTWKGSRYLAAVQSYLGRLHHGSDALSNPAASFWAPSTLRFKDGYSFKYADHIQSLEIPRLVNAKEPVLLLHDFGTFPSNALLSQRMARIYQGKTNCFFVNGSASGKTRLLLEGLHENWGFYFTAAIDSSTLGSRDISRMLLSFDMESVFNTILPPKDDPTFETCLDVNTRFACRQFSVILLARLVVFKRFLEDASGNPDDGMRYRWLLAQLQPFFLQSSAKKSKRDPFDELKDIMQEWVVPIEFFDEAICETLDSIFSLLPGAPGTPLFIVIDEGNVLADGGEFSFSDAFGEGRPILKELLTTWKHHLQSYDVMLIVAGTEIPQKHFQGDEWSDFQWSSDTGDFGVPEVQREYVSKFLPPALVSSPAGEELQLRIWRWFRGRHRLTASVISQLLTTDFQSPHRLLDFLVWLATDPSVKAAIHDALIHCLVTLDHRLIFGTDRIDAVSRGVGRFIDPNMEQIVIDEPLCLVTCARWFADKKTSLTDIDSYLSVDRKYQRPLSTTCFVALCLAHVFSQPRGLVDVFSFTGALPEWANQTANLVDLSTDLGMLHYTPGTSRRLAYVAETPADTLTWLKDKHRTVFCIHSANSASPALLFSLRLADGSCVWLFLHVNLDGSAEGLVPKTELQDMLKALQPEHLFNERTNEETPTPESPTGDQGSPSPVEIPSTVKSETSYPPKESEESDDIRKLLEGLPNRNRSAGACSVLRVVASLRADAKIDRLDVDVNHPIAELNTRFVQSITEKFSGKDILEDIVANATHTGGYMGVKRKTIDDSEGPTLKRQRSV